MLRINDHRKDANSTNFKLSIPHLTDLLNQSAEQKEMMDEIMQNIFNHAAVVDISEKIGGKNV